MIKKSIKRKNSNLKNSVIISAILHIACIIWMSLFYTKENKSNVMPLINKKISINLTSIVPATQQSPTQFTSVQEKLNNIKMLEKIPAISTQQSPTQFTSVQEKLNNIKMLEKIPAISTQQSPTQFTSVQIGKSSPILAKKINKNNKQNDNTYKCNLNHLLIQLTDPKNILELNDNTEKRLQGNSFPNKNKKQKENSFEINVYKKKITQSISDKFFDDPAYFGQKCVLHAHLSLDGTLTNITCSDNDSPLCQAAMAAAKSSKSPPPPTSRIYEIFKNITLNFSP